MNKPEVLVIKLSNAELMTGNSTCDTDDCQYKYCEGYCTPVSSFCTECDKDCKEVD